MQLARRLVNFTAKINLHKSMIFFRAFHKEGNLQFISFTDPDGRVQKEDLSNEEKIELE